MPANGHDLAAQLIEKHGVDRYPSVAENLLKLVEELGELVKEILATDDAGDYQRHAVAKEYADVGLTLHALGSKLGLDLMTEMKAVVEHETRVFARVTGAGT
jgi:NTP pyrophosphatase (non-canonical NTP hydrolase)